MFQSYILENRIAPFMGFQNKRLIYDELQRRTEIIERMVERDLTHFDDVFDLLDIFYIQGWDEFVANVETWVGKNHEN